ncbi:MAG: hypothetical protein ACK5ZJ_22800 [Acidobacteriota bacterium]
MGKEELEECSPTHAARSYPASRKVGRVGGVAEVEWDEDGAAGLDHGLVEFIEFLKISGLNGDWRYAHTAGTGGEGVLPKLSAIQQSRTEGSIRPSFEKQDEQELTLRLDRQLDITGSALLRYEWVLHPDATVKTRQGGKKEAKVGYNS